MTTLPPAPTHHPDKPFGIFVGLLNAIALYAAIGLLLAVLL